MPVMPAVVVLVIVLAALLAVRFGADSRPGARELPEPWVGTPRRE